MSNRKLRRAQRLAEWRDLDSAMRERVSLAPAPVPVPLHRMGQQRARQAAGMMDTVTALPRCPVPACPVRYRTGGNRLCAHHRDDDSAVGLAERMAAFEDLAAPPGGHGGDEDTP